VRKLFEEPSYNRTQAPQLADGINSKQHTNMGGSTDKSVAATDHKNGGTCCRQRNQLPPH